MSWCFYVLRCGDNSLYAGSTNDMERRLAAHKAGSGARYTSGRGPLSLELVEPHADRGCAQRAEAAFKKLPRAEKLEILNGQATEAFLLHKLEDIDLDAGWEDPRWSKSKPKEIARWRHESGAFRPRTLLRLAWNQGGVWGIFRVEDQNVRAVETRPNAPVYADSCVEVFLEPQKGGGYFNFEWNAGGTMLAGFVTDPTRDEYGAVKGLTLLKDETADLVEVKGSLGTAPFEVPGTVLWTLSFRIPFELLGLKGVEGEEFKGNFFKCGDRTLTPHWGSWKPLTAKNFHQPENFGHFYLIA